MSLKFQSRGAASPGTKAGLVKSKMTGNAKFVFPADLIHMVYPFYNSDEERVTISGNISLDTRPGYSGGNNG